MAICLLCVRHQGGGGHKKAHVKLVVAAGRGSLINQSKLTAYVYTQSESYFIQRPLCI